MRERGGARVRVRVPCLPRTFRGPPKFVSEKKERGREVEEASCQIGGCPKLSPREHQGRRRGGEGGGHGGRWHGAGEARRSSPPRCRARRSSRRDDCCVQVADVQPIHVPLPFIFYFRREICRDGRRGETAFG